MIYVPLGQFLAPSAWRKSLTGVVDGPATPMFWNADKKRLSCASAPLGGPAPPPLPILAGRGATPPPCAPISDATSGRR